MLDIDTDNYIQFVAYTLDWSNVANELKFERTDLKMRGCTLQDKDHFFELHYPLVIETWSKF